MMEQQQSDDLAPVERAVGYIKTDDLVGDAEHIIDAAQRFVHGTVNVALVRRNWLLGRRIVEEDLGGEKRATYGASVIKELSKSLTKSRGRGFTPQNLYRFVQFYRTYPDIFSSAMRKSSHLLTWTHYLALLRVNRSEARAWYEREAPEQGWSVRTLERNISTLYYDRLLASGNKQPVIDEMHQKTSEYEQNRLEFVKNPVVAEFLGVPQDKSFVETDLEQAIIDNLQ